MYLKTPTSYTAIMERIEEMELTKHSWHESDLARKYYDDLHDAARRKLAETAMYATHKGTN